MASRSPTTSAPGTVPWNATPLAWCPACGAGVGAPCVDEDDGTVTPRWGAAWHRERHERLGALLLDGAPDARPGEPGPHAALYVAKEIFGGGHRPTGPVLLDPREAAVRVAALGNPGYVARWDGARWQKVDVD
jgi:hypothetical protein